MSTSSSIDYSKVVKVKDENYRFCLSQGQDATWVKRLYGDSTVHGLFTLLSEYPTDSTTREEGAKRVILHDSALSCCGKVLEPSQSRAKNKDKSRSGSKSALNRTEPVSAGEKYEFRPLSEEDYTALHQMSSSHAWDPVKFLDLVKTIPIEEITQQSTPTTQPKRKPRRQASTSAPYPTPQSRRDSRTHPMASNKGDTHIGVPESQTTPGLRELLDTVRHSGGTAYFELPHSPQLASGYSQDGTGFSFGDDTTGLVYHDPDQGGFGFASNTSPFTNHSQGNSTWQPNLGDGLATSMFNSPSGEISSLFHPPLAQGTLDTQLVQDLIGPHHSQGTRVPQEQSYIPVPPGGQVGDQSQMMVGSAFDPNTTVQYNYDQSGQFGAFNQFYQPDQTHADLVDQANAPDQTDPFNQTDWTNQSSQQGGNTPWPS